MENNTLPVTLKPKEESKYFKFNEHQINAFNAAMWHFINENLLSKNLSDQYKNLCKHTRINVDNDVETIILISNSLTNSDFDENYFKEIVDEIVNLFKNNPVLKQFTWVVTNFNGTYHVRALDSTPTIL